ncbi:Pentatricopeptide repeat-containing protein [Rhynchospora pubera]|uniref:Pentatricopeptide repeat-containing protein n=1 Tax=Rhynchospora pubera TaxID=906938 RepID=A0AAV8FPZ2_9POAL|nr:Pentatricopeptide repeat-containing protein [Rhynchospora pubera]
MEAKALLSSSLPTPFFPSKTLSPPPLPSPPKSSNKLTTSALSTSASIRHVFPQSLPLHTKNPHIINRTLQTFARESRLREALTVLDYLEQQGIPVNATTLSALLVACANRKSLFFGRQIHVHVRINGLESNEYVLAKLVYMYFSCGAYDEALELLSKNEVKNFYAWNAMMKSSVRNGPRWDRSPVEVFSRMREAGVDFNEYTMSWLIKSFAGSPAPRLGMQAHALLMKNAFMGYPVMLHTCLIDMYFKCVKIRDAMKLFDEIPERDVVLWCTVISGFAHKGLKWEALKYFRWMLQDEIEPNSILLSSILSVVADISDLYFGREIHCFALKKYTTYDKLSFVLSSLVDMYCKCGDVLSARQVFYGVKERNVVMWTSILSGYALNGRPDMALRSLLWMQREGIRPDVVVIGTVLPVCTQLKALKQGKEIHAYSLKRWFIPNVSISTCLISMYAASENIDYAQKVFDQIVTKSVIAWTALIDAYIKNEKLYHALDSFRSMLRAKKRPDAISICRVLSVCGSLGEVNMGKEIHAYALKMRMKENHFVCSEIITMYGKSGDLIKAHKVFDGIQSQGVLTCTSIIEAYRLNNHCKEALNLFDRLVSDGFVPNNYTFDVVLAVGKKAGWDHEVVRLFNSMVRDYGLKPSVENYDCVIEVLNQAGRNNEAQRFVDLKSQVYTY